MTDLDAHCTQCDVCGNWLTACTCGPAEPPPPTEPPAWEWDDPYTDDEREAADEARLAHPELHRPRRNGE